MGTRWLASSELEMSCHSDVKPPLCHRKFEGDIFGISCVRYTDPETARPTQRMVGVTCHKFMDGHCHIAMDFVVSAKVAAEMSCPTQTEPVSLSAHFEGFFEPTMVV